MSMDKELGSDRILEFCLSHKFLYVVIYPRKKKRNNVKITIMPPSV